VTALIEFRAFCNPDLPRLAEIWRGQPGGRGLMQPMSAAVLERFVLAKPYFDRHGLIVARDGDKVLGFAHSGFGPGSDENSLSTDQGVISLVMVRPEIDDSVASQLLERSESYLHSRGAKELYGGGYPPLAPFYFGLYGGSELSGVLKSDPREQALFARHGYQPAKTSLVLHRDLGQFRPVVDRQQMQIRRHSTFQTIVDPPSKTWWDACLFEPLERAQFLLVPREGGATLASAYFWNMETMTGTWGVRAVGIAGLTVGADQKRQGMATYLLGEAFRQFHTQGIALAEVHVADDNAAAMQLFNKLGFVEVDQAVCYRKV
jgi:GNAT superfamily N-acetyltransferase